MGIFLDCTGCGYNEIFYDELKRFVVKCVAGALNDWSFKISDVDTSKMELTSEESLALMEELVECTPWIPHGTIVRDGDGEQVEALRRQLQTAYKRALKENMFLLKSIESFSSTFGELVMIYEEEDATNTPEQEINRMFQDLNHVRNIVKELKEEHSILSSDTSHIDIIEKALWSEPVIEQFRKLVYDGVIVVDGKEYKPKFFSTLLPDPNK